MKNGYMGECSLVRSMATASGLKSGQAFQNGTLNGVLVKDAETASPYNAPVEIATDKLVKHYVSNVLTYAAAVEATWGAIDVGDKVYYDLSGLKDDPNQATGVKIRLTTSPKDKADANNVQYGVAAEAMTTATATVSEIYIKMV